MQAGDCFVFRSGKDGRHLWVVTSDPFKNPKQVLIVNLTTIRGVRYEDLSCVFQAGEHHWVEVPSYVAFDRAQVVTSEYLDRLEGGTTIKTYNPLSEDLLKRIRDGAALSDSIELGHLQILVDQGFVVGTDPA